MTDKQKTDMITLRGKGYGYKKIALALDETGRRAVITVLEGRPEVK